MKIEIGGVYNFTNKTGKHPLSRNKAGAVIILERARESGSTYGGVPGWEWVVCNIEYLFDLRNTSKTVPEWCVMENELTPID